MRIQLRVLLYIAGVAEMSAEPGRKWIRTASGFAPVSGFTLKVSVRGVVDCSRVCSQLSATRSYFYYQTSGECQCHDATYSASDAGVQVAPNVRYYEEEMATETVGSLSCPVGASAPSNVISSGSSRFRIRIFADVVQNFLDSETRCAAIGGTLYKAITLEKYQIVVQLITQCPDLDALGALWVNGIFTNSVTRFQTTDGETVPMTTDYWTQPSTLGNGGIGDGCVWLWSVFNYKFDDIDCTSSRYAVCEIPE